jgi:hypothetical protein
LTEEAAGRDLLDRLMSESARERIKALRRLRRSPDARPDVVVRVEELLGDRTVDIIEIPIRYGEIRLLAAESLAAIRGAMGDERPVVLKGVPRSLTAERMAPLEVGLELPRMGAIEMYETLRELERIPTFDYSFDPADYGVHR